MTTDTASPAAPQEARQHWMGTLAKAPLDSLETAWAALAAKPRYTALRAPEVGSTLVRARAGGTGDRFNLGEMTMARCVVRLDDGPTGFGYVAGRSKRHAELAALFDALLQVPEHHDTLQATLIAPLAEAEAARRTARSREAAGTRVDFFTLVRGES